MKMDGLLTWEREILAFAAVYLQNLVLAERVKLEVVKEVFPHV